MDKMKKTDAERLMKKQEDPQQGDVRFDYICHHERCSNDVSYLASVTNKNMFCLINNIHGDIFHINDEIPHPAACIVHHNHFQHLL